MYVVEGDARARPAVAGVSDRRCRLAVIATTAVGVALALGALVGRSLWLDESVSVMIARLPTDRFVDVLTGREGNMTLYHVVLRAWLALGTSAWFVRLLSVVCAAVTIPLVFLLAARLLSRRAALVAALVVAVDPVFVHYGAEARGYALCLALVTLSTYALVRLLETPARRWAVTYALATALAAYAHFFALLVPVAHLLAVMARGIRSGAARRLLPTAVATGALLVPLALLLTGGGGAGVEWAMGSAPGRLVMRVRSIVPRPVGAVLVVAFVGGLALAWRSVPTVRDRVRSFRPRWEHVLVAAWLVVPFVAVAFVSYFYKPLFVVRYFIVCLPAVALAIGAIVDRIGAAARLAIVGLVVVASVAGVVRGYATGESEDWQHATRYVEQSGSAGDGVLFYAPYVRIPFEYYLRDATARAGLRPVYPSYAWGTNGDRITAYVPVTRGRVGRALTAYDRVWLVVSHAQLYGGADPGFDAVHVALDSGFRRVSSRSFTGVTVEGYERATPASN